MASNDSPKYSILEGVNLDDHEEIRKFMTGFEYHLTHSILNVSFEAVCHLSESELALIANIMACIRNNGTKYPLLLEASLRFVSGRHRDAQGVLAAAREFHNLAEEQVLTTPYLFPEEYKAAEVRMTAIRGKIDIMRVRQRLAELAPGAFGEQIYHTGRSAEIEKMVARDLGDVRDIPRDIQFAPHPVPDGPRSFNSGPCYQCTRDNKPCDCKEPKCTTRRTSWRQCLYTTPSRIIQEPVVQSPGSSPLSYQSSTPAVSSRKSSPESPAVRKATATKPTVTKPAAWKLIEKRAAQSTTASKPSASKLTIPQTEAPKATIPKTAASKPAVLKTTTSQTETLNRVALKTVQKSAASDPEKPLLPLSGRVTRSTVRLQFLTAGELDNRSIPLIPTAGNEANSPQVPVNPQTETGKRKQEDHNDLAGPSSSKKVKLDVTIDNPATNTFISGVKRPAADAELDDETNPNSGIPKPDSAVKIAPKIDSKSKKRRGGGRKNVDHEGEKLCNTCQGWKPIADYAPKKHSKTPGATVGYCVGCQGKKQAKNKAKAEAKARAKYATAQSSEVVGLAGVDEDIEDESEDDATEEDNKTADAIIVKTEG